MGALSAILMTKMFGTDTLAASQERVKALLVWLLTVIIVLKLMLTKKMEVRLLIQQGLLMIYRLVTVTIWEQLIKEKDMPLEVMTVMVIMRMRVSI